MRRYAFRLLLLLLMTSHVYGQSSQQRRKLPPTWYERAARQINPADTQFGSLWEQRKQDFANHLSNPYFRYALAATGVLVVLLSTQFALYLRHRRALEYAAKYIADIRGHDESARRAAREAVQRYNDHLEFCNRVIEGDETGLWKWISGAELGAMKRKTQQLTEELKAAQDEIKHLKEELATKAAAITEMSLRTTKDGSRQPGPPSKQPTPAPHIERINQLELELVDERKKNLRFKGGALDVHNS